MNPIKAFLAKTDLVSNSDLSKRLSITGETVTDRAKVLGLSPEKRKGAFARTFYFWTEAQCALIAAFRERSK